MDKTALHYRYEEIAVKCLIGVKFPFMKGKIINVIQELSVSSKENKIDRICDLCLLTDKGEIYYVEIVSKHELEEDKIEDYYFSNLNCLRVVVPEKNIHCNLPDSTIEQRLLQLGTYEIVSKVEDYRIKVGNKEIVFSDFDDYEYHVDFTGDDGKNYSLLKNNYNSLSNIEYGVISKLYREGRTLLELPNYNINGTVKENILRAVANYV